MSADPNQSDETAKSREDFVVFDDTEEVVDEENDSKPETGEDDSELDGIRIRQLAALRRGAIRSRSWCLITATVCGVGAIELIRRAMEYVYYQRRLGLLAGGFLLFAIGGAMAAVFFLHRARQLKREIEHSDLSEPETPPDFSTLGDGSQQWKNLEDIR